jgi:hypothetical protein
MSQTNTDRYPPSPPSAGLTSDYPRVTAGQNKQPRRRVFGGRAVSRQGTYG